MIYTTLRDIMQKDNEDVEPVILKLLDNLR